MPAVAKVGGLSAFLPAPDPLPEEVTLTGALHEDSHGDIPEDCPETAGRVTAAWEVSWEYQQREDGAHPVEGTARFESIGHAPTRLPDRARSRGERRLATSVLVHLEVTSR